MSVHNLAVSNQFEINAKTPTIVDSVTDEILNMKIGREINHELKEYHYGFSPGMGRVSQNAETVLGLVLEYFQVQGTNDRVHMGYANKEQLPGITDIKVVLGALSIDLVWSAVNENYESAEIAGIGDAAKLMVGGSYPMAITDTTV